MIHEMVGMSTRPGRFAARLLARRVGAEESLSPKYREFSCFARCMKPERTAESWGAAQAGKTADKGPLLVEL
jgi:hypothetical protein